MTEEYGNGEYKSHIIDHLREKETDELLAIWEENDRTEWTEEAFEVMRAILLERLGRVPDQGTPRDEYDDPLDDEEDQPEPLYPAERKLIWIAELASKLAWIYLGVTIIYSLFIFADRFIFQPTAGFGSSAGFQDLLQLIYQEVDRLIMAGIFFVLLQAMTEIIYLIMDIRALVEPEESEAPFETEITSSPAEEI
jgi:hypothetical protein